MTYKQLVVYTRQEFTEAGDQVVAEIEQGHTDPAERERRLRKFLQEMDAVLPPEPASQPSVGRSPATRMKRPQDSFWVFDKLFDLPLEISPKATLIFVCLTRHADATGSSWPGSRRIARECRLHSRDVEPSVAELVAQNMVKVEPSGPNRVKGYCVLPPEVWRSVSTVGDTRSGECLHGVSTVSPID
jgi:hypothetical protein